MTHSTGGAAQRERSQVALSSGWRYGDLVPPAHTPRNSCSAPVTFNVNDRRSALRHVLLLRAFPTWEDQSSDDINSQSGSLLKVNSPSIFFIRCVWDPTRRYRTPSSP